jgi:hypothetical protein
MSWGEKLKLGIQHLKTFQILLLLRLRPVAYLNLICEHGSGILAPTDHP